MNTKNVASVTAMLAVVIVALGYMHSVGLSVSDGIGVRKAELRVANANGLVQGSRVLFRGVAIGKVTNVESSFDGVVVRWNYDNSYAIPASSSYRVDNLSALGESYLGVVPGSDDGPSLHDDAVLTARSVTVPTTFDELSARLVRALGQLHTDKVNDLVAEFNSALPSDKGVLTDLNHAGVMLNSAILSTTAPFEQLLKDFQTVLDRGAGLSDSLAASGAPTAAMADKIRVFLDWCAKFIVQDNLPTALTEGAGPFLERAQVFLDKVAPDLKVLGDAALPSVGSATSILKTADLSQLMRIALSTAGSGDAVVLSAGG